jgi:hypothetical protein
MRSRDAHGHIPGEIVKVSHSVVETLKQIKAAGA